MSTILTDDERPKLPETPYQLYYEWPDDEDGYGGSEVVDGDAYTAEQMEAYADAREAAVLAKLREQEPVAWHTEDHLDDRSATTYSKEAAQRWHDKGWPVTPLYAAPLPAVVQVPQGWKLVPVEPTEAMFTRFSQQIHEGVVYVGGFVLAYRMMLGAAPEAPAQSDPLEKLTRIQEELRLYDDKPAQPSVPAPWREAVKVAREALLDVKHGLEGARIWGGMDWAYNPLHPFKYLPLRDKAAAALAQLDALEGGE